MPSTITVEEAQANLKDLIHQLAAGDEIIITENQHPVAKLVSESPRVLKQRPAPGMFPQSIIYMAPDFDAPLEDFKEYME